jgi:hypothetical protein
MKKSTIKKVRILLLLSTFLLEVSAQGYYRVYTKDASVTEIAGDQVDSVKIEKYKGKNYIQFILYGQSLSMGWEAPRALTTTPIDGNYMLGDSPLMIYSNQLPVLSPLKAVRWWDGGEEPIVSCVNVFSSLYRANVDTNHDFIGMSGGMGGQSIERLSKECTNGENYYTSTFTKILDNTLAATNRSDVIFCPAIFYMQGEHNQANWALGDGLGMTPGTSATRDKDEYKQLLLQLKNNMQADIMEKYGQTQKPLFFIYQTSGAWIIYSKDEPIPTAQYEFANENDDVILLNPPYAMPDYGGGHLSTNGYRWYGEIMGKIAYDVLVDHKDYHPVYPLNTAINGTDITITYHVPTPPLVLDTCTTDAATNYGFVVYKNNLQATIQSVEVHNDNQIVIRCAETLTGTVEVAYAGKDSRGTGNLRDSYDYTSKYLYFDDSADTKKESYTPTDPNGIKIYGQPYPMYNWSVVFYKKIQ